MPGRLSDFAEKPASSIQSMSASDHPRRTASRRMAASYTQKLWLGMKTKAAYLPG